MRDVGTDFVLVDLQRGSYFGLNPVGARMWTLLADGRTLGEVAEAVCSMYQAPRERVETDLDALLAALARQGLIED